jgi:phenylalanyl-tRNA synthetase, beta subunit, non-spirochete bacterial
MKLPMQWIKSYADIPADALAYQAKMIMSGTAVEDVYEIAAEIENVVVGKVLTVENVEGSDHLHLCTVDAGQDEILQIVCGAPNVKPGILVPVALNGAKLPGGLKIKKGKLRGIVSEGMLCAATELNVPQDLYPSVGDEGLLIINEDVPVGSDIKPVLGIDDTVIDFEILANRPDCMCAVGIARETAVVMGTAFNAPDTAVNEADGDIHDFVKIDVEDTDLCKRYVGRVVKNIRVKPSPMWLRKALHGAGMRSINNIVDITNYVMLEMGHPMHAFDLDVVKDNHIIVRKAKKGETLKTLDEKEHTLTGIELLICDGEGPTGLAGIMGGLESEITENTKTLLFECAAFDRTGTRLAARGLGIRTESSGRFERGVNPLSCVEAVNRACNLINLLDAGDVVPGIIDIYPNPKKPQTVEASLERIAHRTGVAIPHEKIVEILQSLSFEVLKDGDNITVTVPSFRMDIEGEADLSEEALRIYGYEHIPGTNLRGETTPGGLNPRLRLKNALADKLVAMGYYEIMNFSFQSKKLMEKLNLPAADERLNQLPILNPLGEDTAYMRTSLLPDMLTTLSTNMNRQNDSAALYETAAVYSNIEKTSEGLPVETQMLSMGRYGGGCDFYAIRTQAEALLLALGINTTIEAGADAYYHPGRSCRLVANGQTVATVGEIHPAIRDAFEMKERAYAAEMDLAVVAALQAPMGKVKPLPRFPAVSRDLAVVMDESVPLGPVLAAIEKSGGALMESCRLFDVYRSAQLGEEKKSVAFTFAFRATDHTLTDAEIQAATDKVKKLLETQYNAVIRG